jgi:hypothetical protein
MKILLLRSCLILSGLLFLNKCAFSQSRFEISGGYGLPEVINLKVKYGQNFQIGLSQGCKKSNSPENGLMGSTSLEIYCHFGTNSKYISQRVWYLLAGLNGYYNYYDNSYGYSSGSGFLFYIRFGRTINLSQRIGFTIDLGPMLLNQNVKKHLYLDTSVFPSGNFGFFVRL